MGEQIRQQELKLFLSPSSSTNYDKENVINANTDHLDQLVKAFVEGQYAVVLNGELSVRLLAVDSSNSAHSLESLLIYRLEEFLKTGQEAEEWERQFGILLLGVSSLQLFVQNNWTGPPLAPPAIAVLSESPNYYLTQLQEDEEPVYATLRNPELLWLAKVLLGKCVSLLKYCPTASWWRLRYVYVHQQVLEERCPSLFAIVSEELEKLSKLNAQSFGQDAKTSLIQLYLESFQVSLLYYNHAKATEYLHKAQTITGLSMNLTGALGKRTQFQQRDIAQLTLKVERDTSPVINNDENISISPISGKQLPKDLKLNDDVRLETVKFKDGEIQIPTLGDTDQAVILGYFTHIQKSNAIHRLVTEELMTYLTILLSNPRNWIIQSASLLQRSILESNQSRSIERSMMQIQALIDQFNTPTSESRLHLIYSTAFPPLCILEKEMAKVYRKMGAINSALEVYLRLEDWENAIACYHILQRRDKAEAIVRQQLAIKETPNLYCYLGDATDNPEWYFKAWELSNHRSARAQKSLGMLYFRKKEYEKCLPHLEQSVNINGIQLDTWFSLAFSAMQVENWELTAKAYRRCINLEPDNFEAWNNLSNAYIKLNQKPRAWRTLQEALKCNYEDWRIWENYILVSVDCGGFSEVIKAYHRVLDLKGKHLDNEVLGILVKAVIEGMYDNEGKSASNLFPKLSELFGRLTATITNNGQLWRLYGQLISSKADITEEELQKVVQYYQKSHRSLTQTTGWEKDVITCKDVLESSIDLANAYLQISTITNTTIATQHLSSAKLMLNSTISTIKQYEKSTGMSLATEIVNSLELLQEKLQTILEKLKSHIDSV